jgi:putative NADH-flavin reductase
VRIALLGATGKTGPFVLDRATAGGHDVTVLARTPAQVAPHQSVQAVEGDVLDSDSVDGVVRGHDAVIWLVSGPNTRRTPAEEWVCRDGTRNVLASMQRHGVRRLAAVSSWGVGDSRARVPLFFRLVVLPLALRAEMRDKGAQEAEIGRSAVDWTIVRPTRLVDRASSAALTVGRTLSYRPWASTSRPALAQLLVALAGDGGHVRSIVEVSSTGASVRR